MVGDHMGILGAVVLPFPFAVPTRAGPADRRRVVRGAGLCPQILTESENPQKRELVASRFTLQGLLRRHAGKSGPFLLHGGQAPTRCKPDRGCLFPGTAAGGCAVAKCEWWLRWWASL